MRKRLLVGCAAALAVLGCESNDAGSRLSAEAQPSGGAELDVDDACGASCTGGDSVQVKVALAASPTVQKPSVQLLQYRVDYSLPLPGKVPFYARQTSLQIADGSNASQSLVVVGAAQRAFVERAAGTQTVSGTATITLAGYDADDNQAFVTATFDVSFGPAPTSGATPGASPGATDAGAGGGGDAD